MKQTLLTCFRYLIPAAGGVLLLLFLSASVLIMGWPWWVGIFLVLVLLGLLAGALFLWKIMLRRRDQLFVQEVMEKEPAGLNLPDGEQNQLKELQESWKEAVETLRRSHLKRQGNPLYVLPWYLVLGGSGCGKSTAIASARLSSPFTGMRTSDRSGTRNCDWWFLDQAVLIDTAGRYSIPVDPVRDNEEWRKFLSLLVKYRGREPINGLVMTVAADRLLSGSQEDLENEGRQLRRRMDELMRVLGIRFPTYVLITKCDLVRGMIPFSDRLPEKSLEQPMGVCNEELSRDLPAFLERVAARLSQRLKLLRLLMLHQPGHGDVGSELLLFPDQLQSLKPGLDLFMSAAFKENRYQDTPLLRGIYLCSGHQEGISHSTLPDDPGLTGGKEGLAGTSRGVFLHDFFAKILPLDRGLPAPTTRAMQWKSLTRNLGLTSWVLLGIAASGLLSYSFMKNMATIREATAVIARAPELSGNFAADLATMDRFRKMILDVEQNNRNWWVPRLGLDESRKVEMALKGEYCRRFRDRFLVPFDKNMGNAIAGFSTATPDEVAGNCIVHLSRRINLVKARLDGGGLDLLQARPLPSFLLSALPQEGDRETGDMFGDLYMNHLVWRVDSVEPGKELQVLQSWLKQVFVVKGTNLAWVVELVNRQENGSGLTLQSFWGGSRSVAGEPGIAPAFTRKGKECVGAVLGEIRAAHPEPERLERDLAGFQGWYRGSCFAAWQRFASFFPRGEERLNGVKEWQSAAQVMATDNGPYFAFLKRAVTELEPFGAGEEIAPWLSQACRYQMLKAAGPATGTTFTAAQGTKIAERLGKFAGKRGAEIDPAGSAKAVQDYLVALRQIAPAGKSRNLAHQMALQLFTEEAGVGKSPFYQAADAVQRLNRSLAGARGDDTFLRLISSPIAFYGTFVRKESACVLQKQWEEKVLKDVYGAADSATLQYLVGREGPVSKFVSDAADPFIGWKPGRGYYAKVALGGAVPFEPGFYSFLAKGAKVKVAAATAPRQNYNVTVKGLPTDANSESRIKPQSTRLELFCASGLQVMENLNFPVSRTFVWSPESCSDLLLQIGIGELAITKRYAGFPEFLHDFPGGRRTFHAGEFSRHQQALERMGVRFIRVNYQIFGGQELAAAGGAKTEPAQVPARIADCWD